MDERVGYTPSSWPSRETRARRRCAIGRWLRARDVNWGDRSRLEGRKPQTLAWVSLPESSSIVVYAHANIRNGSSICSVSIEWGNGGASVAGEYPVIKRLRVPLVASMVKLSGRLVAPDGSPAIATDAADVSAFVATGLDGDPSAWIRCRPRGAPRPAR